MLKCKNCRQGQLHYDTTEFVKGRLKVYFYCDFCNILYWRYTESKEYK
jgi:hypothetical protein